MRESIPLEVQPGTVSGPEATPQRRVAPEPRLTAGRSLALSLAAFVLTLGVQLLLTLGLGALPGGAPAALSGMVTVIGFTGFGSTVVLAAWGVARAVADLFRAPVGRVGPYGPLASLALAAASLVMMGFGALAALISTFGFSRGRQLRRRGRVLLPPVREGGAWASAGFVLENAAMAPQGLAEQWRENGRTEHASVASFARLTLDLMALGAPPALVALANQDALDEIRHTQACFSLAQAIDGESASPGPFPEAQSAHTLPRTRTFALAKLAVDSLVDGALHEGVSARIIAKLARRCEDPTIALVLKQIAADEGRHAAHGWDVVEWCLAEGGRPVAQALLGATRALPDQMRSNLPESASAGGWEPWGIHGHALEAEQYAATRAHLLDRVRTLAASADRNRLAALGSRNFKPNRHLTAPV